MKATAFFGKVLPWVAFVCFAAAMLFDPARDTLGVASAAFAVTLALAAVTFSYARTLKDGSMLREELIFAGERMVGGAVLFLVASILKHASNDVPRYVNNLFNALGLQPPDVTFFGQDPIGFIIAFAAFMIFLVGLVYAQMGIVMMLGVAGYRAKRRPNQNEAFIAAKTYEQRLADAENKEKEASLSNNRSPDRPSPADTSGRANPSPPRG
jgi:hypothetical protein